MANDKFTFEFDDAALQKFFKNLDLIQTKIDKAQESFEGLQKTVNKFDFKFKNMANLDTFNTLLDKIGNTVDASLTASLLKASLDIHDSFKLLAQTPTKNIRNISDAIKEFGGFKVGNLENTADSFFAVVTPLRKIVENFTKLVEIDATKITQAEGALLKIASLAASIPSTVVKDIQVFAKAVQGTFTGLDKFVVLADSLRKLSRALVDLSKIKEGDYGKVGENLKAFIKPLTEATAKSQLIRVLGGVGVLIPIAIGLTALINPLSLIVGAASLLTAGGFALFAKGLENFVKSLSTIGDLLGKGFFSVVGNILKFGVAVPAIILSITAVMKLVSFLNFATAPLEAFNTKFVNNFEKFTQGMKNITSALGGNRGPKQQGANTVSKELVDAVDGVTGSLRLVPDKVNIMSEALFTIGRGFSNVVSVVGNIIKIGIIFPAVFTALSVVFKLIGVLSASVPGSDELDKLTTAMRRVGQFFVDVTQSLGGNRGQKSEGQSQLKGGSSAAAGLSEFIFTLGRGIANIFSVAANVIKLGVIAPALFTALAVTFKGVATVLNLVPDNGELVRLTAAFKGIAEAFSALSNSFGSGITGTIVGIVKLLVVVPVAFTELAVVFKVVAGLMAFLPDDGALERMSGAFEAIGKGIRNLAKLGDLDRKQISNAGKVIKEIGKALQQITEKLISRGIIDEFVQVAESFSSVGAGVKRIIDGTKDISFPTLFKVMINMKLLGIAIRDLLDLRGLDANAAETFGTTIQAVGQGVKNITSSVNGKNKDAVNIFNLIKTVFAVKALINAVVNSLKGVSTDVLDSSGKLFASLGQAIKNIFDALNTKAIKNQKVSNVLSFEEKFKVIQRVFNEIRKFKNATLPDFSSFIKGLPGFLDLAEKLGKGEGNLSDMKSGIKNLVEALNELRNLKVNSGQADAFAKTTEALSKLEPLKNIGRVAAGAKSLKEFFTTFSTLKIDSGAAKNLQKLGKGIAGLFTEISKSKLSKESISALSDLAKVLGEVNKAKPVDGKKLMPTSADSKRIGVDTGLDIAKGVEDGVLRANLRQTITGIFINIFKEIALLPINIVKGFSSLSGVFKDFGSAAVQSFRDIKSNAREMLDNLRDVGENIRDFADNLSRFSPTALFSSEAFQSATDFDRLGTQLEVFGGLNAEARAEAEAFALQLGKDYPISANEALAATLDLIKAGQDLSSVQFILPSAADLAALSDSGDINAATNTLIAAQAAFQEFAPGVEGSFENINVAANILAAGADISTASIESLSDGLANVGPAASSFGLSFDETVAILSIFDENAIRGAEGGTALRSTLNALGRPQTINQLRNLGVELFEINEATGQMERRGINDVINDLNGALSGMNAQQQSAALQQLADTFGRQGLQVLLAQGTDGIQNVVNEMNQVDPAADRARQMLDNLAGDLEQLRGSVDTLMTKAMLPLIDTIARPLVQAARFFIDTLLTLNDEILAVMTTALAFGSILIGGVSVILTIVGSLIQFGAIVGLVGLALFQTGAALSAFLVGLAAFTTGLLAVIAITTVVVPLFLAIASVFRILVNVFQNNIGGATTAVVGFFTTIKDGIVGSLGVLYEFGRLLSSIFSGASSAIITNVGSNIARTFNGFKRALDDSTIGRFFRFAQSLAEGLRVINDLIRLRRDISSVTESIGGFAALGQEEQADAAMERLRDLRTEFRVAASDLIRNNEFFRAAMLRMGGTVDDFLNTLDILLRSVGQNIQRGLVSPIIQFLSSIREVGFSEAFAELRNDVESEFSYLVSSFLNVGYLLFGDQQIFRDIQAVATQGFDAVFQVIVDNLVNKFRTLLIANRDTLTEIVTFFLSRIFIPGRFIRTIANFLGLDQIASVANTYITTLENLFRNIVETIFNLIEGQDLTTALRNAFGEGIEPVLRFISQIGSVLQQAVGVVTDILGRLFFSPSEQQDVERQFSIGDLIASVLNRISNILQSVSENVLQPLRQFIQTVDFSSIQEFFTTVVTTISTGLGLLFAADFSGGLDAFRTAIALIITSFLSLFGFNFSGDELKDRFITPIVEAFSSFQDLGQSLAGAFGVFSSIGTTILNLIITGIQNAITSVSVLTGIDFSGILSILDATILANIKSSTNIFATIGNTIIGLLGAAISTALTTLGTVLDLDVSGIASSVEESLGGVFDALNALFVGSDVQPSGIQNAITFINNLVTAITNFIAAIGGSGDTVESEGSGFKAAMQGILNFLTRITAFTFDTLTIGIEAINSLFAALASLTPQQLLGLTILVSSISTLVALRMSGGFALAVTKLQTLATSAKGFASTGLAIAALFFIIRSGLENIDTLLESLTNLFDLDIAGFFSELVNFIGQVSIDAVFDILGLLGIDNIAGVTREQLEIVLSQLVFLLNRLFRTLQQTISNIINIAINALAIGIQSIISQIPGQNRAGFQNVQTFFGAEEGVTLDQVVEFKANMELGEIEADPAVFENFVQLSRGVLIEEFKANPAVLTTEEILLFEESDILDEALFATLDTLDTTKINQAFTSVIAAAFESGIDPATLIDPNVINQTIDTFRVAMETGLLSPENAILDLSSLISTFVNLTGEAPPELVAALNDMLVDAGLQFGADGKLIPVTVGAEVTVETETVTTDSEETAAAAQQTVAEDVQTGFNETPIEAEVDVNATVRNVNVETGEVPEGEAPVLPNPEEFLNFEGAGDPAALREEVAALEAQITQLRSVISVFNTEVPLMIENLILFDETGLTPTLLSLQELMLIFEERIPAATIAMLTFTFTSNAALLSFIVTTGLVGLAISRMSSTIVTGMAAATTAFVNFGNKAFNIINTIHSGANLAGAAVNKLGKALSNAATAAAGLDANLKSAQASQAAGGGGTGTSVQGERYGGPVSPNNIYEFNEPGLPFEIYRAQGRNFFIPNTAGEFISPQNAPKLPGPQQGVSRGGFGGGSTSIQFVEGSIQFNVTTLPGQDTEAIAAAISARVSAEQNNNRQNLAARLRTAGES